MKAVAVLLAAAVVLLAVELGLGGWTYGAVRKENPCVASSSFRGSGLDAAIQRIVLDGLDGAACRLHTTRERLVLSLSPSSGFPIPWTQQRIADAVRAGLLASIDRSEARGDIPAFVAIALREIVAHTPVRFLTGGVSGISNLLKGLLGG